VNSRLLAATPPHIGLFSIRAARNGDTLIQRTNQYAAALSPVIDCFLATDNLSVFSPLFSEPKKARAAARLS
jgi:hypothetical protein